LRPPADLVGARLARARNPLPNGSLDGLRVGARPTPTENPLEEHQRIRASGWSGRVIPTFRPDAVVNIQTGYAGQIQHLSQVSGVDVTDYRSYIAALEQRQHFFKHMGATATDHAAQTAYTERLSERE